MGPQSSALTTSLQSKLPFTGVKASILTHSKITQVLAWNTGANLAFSTKVLVRTNSRRRRQGPGEKIEITSSVQHSLFTARSRVVSMPLVTHTSIRETHQRCVAILSKVKSHNARDTLAEVPRESRSSESSSRESCPRLPTPPILPRKRHLHKSLSFPFSFLPIPSLILQFIGHPTLFGQFHQCHGHNEIQASYIHRPWNQRFWQ